MMPELDGFGVLEAMHEHELCRRIPVIVLTGQRLTQDDMARLNQGVTRVLEKGVLSVDETLSHIQAVLDQGTSPIREAQQIVRSAIAYMHAHYAEPLSSADLASAAAVSERHLARCFRQEMNLTVHTYLNRYRVRQARHLLDTSDASITEIAHRVGFSSSAYFGQVFRQETGLSPSGYRRGEPPPQDMS
jgi:transcriptional regulator GlxA family with amidase domain